MELIGLDTSRVVFFAQLHRLAGQPYLPEAVAKLVQRYSFAKFPALDELQKDVFMFGIGKFRDVQINEFGIYSDGFLVAARSGTDLLNDFIGDVVDWLEEEIGLTLLPNAKTERHFESAVVVQSSVDLATVVSPDKAVTNKIISAMEGATGVAYVASGTLFDCDQTKTKTRRKPARFSIERRLGLPYSDNIFYCQAPLRTDDHLALLQALEALARG